MAVPTPRGEINDAVLAAAQDRRASPRSTASAARRRSRALAYGTATIPPVEQDRRPRQRLCRRRQAPGLRHRRHRHDRRPVRGAGHRRQLRQSRLGRRRPPGAGRARRRRAVDPRHHRRRARRRASQPRSSARSRCCRAQTSPAKAGTSSAPSSSSRSLAEAVELANRIASEHVELMVDDPQALLPKIRNAGAIFLGHHTPEAIGDYVGGSNHVLPTARSARFASGLGVLDFMKRTSILGCDPASLAALRRAAVTLADDRGARRARPLDLDPAQPLMALTPHDFDPKTDRIVAVTLDPNTITSINPDEVHEWRIAIYDLVEDNKFHPARVEGEGPLRAPRLDHRQLHRPRRAQPRHLRADRRALSVADPVPPADPRLFPHPRQLLRGDQDRLDRSRSRPSTWRAAASTTRPPSCCAPASTTSSRWTSTPRGGCSR